MGKIVVLLFLASNFLYAQDHQDTVRSVHRSITECRSDAAIFKRGEDARGIRALKISEIAPRSNEMGLCNLDYKEQEFQQRFEAYQEDVTSRLFSFVARHNLTEQFKKEDEAGER